MANRGKQSLPEFGFVYLLSNPCLASLKLGSTKNDPQDRCDQLSRSTAIPRPFKIHAVWRVRNYKYIEQHLKRMLASNCVGKEFFMTDTNEIEFWLQLVAPNAQKYEEWYYETYLTIA